MKILILSSKEALELAQKFGPILLAPLKHLYVSYAAFFSCPNIDEAVVQHTAKVRTVNVFLNKIEEKTVAYIGI